MHEITFRFFVTMVLALASLPVPAAIVPEGQASAPSKSQPAEKPETSGPPPAVTGSRGQMLYENHCMRCHASVLHVRDNRRADSLKVLEGWVRRWSREEKLDWSEEEVVDVVDYLNRRYYKFPPPGGKK